MAVGDTNGVFVFVSFILNVGVFDTENCLPSIAGFGKRDMIGVNVGVGICVNVGVAVM